MGTGFDISENFTDEGRRLVRETDLDAEFVTTDIYYINESYADCFDLLLIHKQHPYTNMLAMPSEENYDTERPDQVVFSYFKEEPWIDYDGVDYIGETTYESKTLYSFSHSFATILNAFCNNDIVLKSLREFDCDISTCWPHLNHKGMPLSDILVAHKGNS
tara:strand:- start:184 stop:666 length:483 start_codon:yes stop_codon:yes gene_type:complete